MVIVRVSTAKSQNPKSRIFIIFSCGNPCYRKYGPGHRAFTDFPIQVNFDVRSTDEENGGNDLWNRITSEKKIEWPENLEFISELMTIVMVVRKRIDWSSRKRRNDSAYQRMEKAFGQGSR